MPLDAIVRQALVDAEAAFNAFGDPYRGPSPFRDLWVTTSAQPCIFCITMAALSRIVLVSPGGRFPAPVFSGLPYVSGLGLTYVNGPKAHDNCQCERVTVRIS